MARMPLWGTGGESPSRIKTKGKPAHASLGNYRERWRRPTPLTLEDYGERRVVGSGGEGFSFSSLHRGPREEGGKLRRNFDPAPHLGYL